MPHRTLKQAQTVSLKYLIDCKLKGIEIVVDSFNKSLDGLLLLPLGVYEVVSVSENLITVKTVPNAQL